MGKRLEVLDLGFSGLGAEAFPTDYSLEPKACRFCGKPAARPLSWRNRVPESYAK
jgi:hypothetical protein